MSQILLAGNRLPFSDSRLYGHLQLVYGGQEMEVQAPDIPIFWLQEWIYKLRPHNGRLNGKDNTAGYGDPQYYDSIAIDIGDRNESEVWEVLKDIQNAFDTQTSVGYGLLSQDSSSFINTILSTIGIDGSVAQIA